MSIQMNATAPDGSALAPGGEHGRLSPRTVRLLLAGVLLLACAVRLGGVFHDLRFSYHGDELHFVKRAMAMGTGDLNPHWFHKPAFLMYILVFCYGLLYLGGAALGRFGSPEEFGAYFLEDQTFFILIGRLVVAAFGVACVYVVYRIATRRLGARSGLLAGAVAAVLFPLVASSQGVKADGPAGFFVALSFLYFLRSREEARWRPLVLAALFAGVAMGTKYYGALLLPAYGLVELWAWLRRRTRLRTALLRATVVVTVFVGGFFVSSPYNFLDPTWGSSTFSWALKSAGLKESDEVYRPDNDAVYKPGPEVLFLSTPHFAGRFVQGRAFGILTVLIVAGAATALARRDTRALGAYVLLAFGGFWLMSCTLNAYHINWRHFNAVAPLMCILVPLGADGLARVTHLRWRGTVPLLVALGLLPTLVEAVEDNLADMRSDSRTVAYTWVIENLPADARMLVDEEGPIFRPGPATVARLRKRLEGLPRDEAFTRHQDTRLDLLERFPSAESRNIDELAHPWWMEQEPTDEQLREAWQNRDMGDPLKERVARSLEEYRAQGVRYVVTNSDAQDRYMRPGAEEKFPSFVALYRDLKALEPLHVVDPATFGGKGPVVWVYDIKQAP